MIALRKGYSKVNHEHFVDAIQEVQAKKKDT
jgi:26S proteasome regulatory subunit T5